MVISPLLNISVHVLDGCINDGGIGSSNVLIARHEDCIKVIEGDWDVAFFKAPHTHGSVVGVQEA